MKEESTEERAECVRLYIEKTHQQFVESLKLTCPVSGGALAGPTIESLQERDWVS